MPQVELQRLYAWVKSISIREISDRDKKSVVRLALPAYIGTRRMGLDKANPKIAAVVEERCHKAWLLFASLVKKFDVAAVDDDKLASLLHQATSNKAGRTEIFNETFAVLAKDYLGEYETGDDATSDDESAPESV